MGDGPGSTVPNDIALNADAGGVASDSSALPGIGNLFCSSESGDWSFSSSPSDSSGISFVRVTPVDIALAEKAEVVADAGGPELEPLFRDAEGVGRDSANEVENDIVLNAEAGGVAAWGPF